MINYYTTTDIHLSIENYTNAGLKQDDIIEMIHKYYPDLYARKSHFNHNIIVKTKKSNIVSIDIIVSAIEDELDEMLKGKTKKIC